MRSSAGCLAFSDDQMIGQDYNRDLKITDASFMCPCEEGKAVP